MRSIVFVLPYSLPCTLGSGRLNERPITPINRELAVELSRRQLPIPNQIVFYSWAGHYSPYSPTTIVCVWSVLGCSRVVVALKWLSKYHVVTSSLINDRRPLKGLKVLLIWPFPVKDSALSAYLLQQWEELFQSGNAKKWIYVKLVVNEIIFSFKMCTIVQAIVKVTSPWNDFSSFNHDAEWRLS